MKASVLRISLISLFIISTSICRAGNIQNALELISEQKYDQAVSLLEKLLDENENNDSTYYCLGKAYMGLREYEDASDNFEEAVELNDGNADYHFWLGQAYAMDAMNSSVISQAFLAPKIHTQYERTVELDPDHLGGRIGLANFYIQAPGIMGGDLDKALEQGVAIVGLDEKQGRLVLANVFLQKEMLDSADAQINLLEEKFGQSREMANIYNSYGYYLLNNDKVEAAIEKFIKQVELNPDNPNSYDSLGDGYRAADRLEDAAAQYRKALELNPDFEASRNNLEEVLEEIEDKAN